MASSAEALVRTAVGDAEHSDIAVRMAQPTQEALLATAKTALTPPPPRG